MEEIEDSIPLLKNHSSFASMESHKIAEFCVWDSNFLAVHGVELTKICMAASCVELAEIFVKKSHLMVAFGVEKNNFLLAAKNSD